MLTGNLSDQEHWPAAAQNPDAATVERINQDVGRRIEAAVDATV